MLPGDQVFVDKPTELMRTGGFSALWHQRKNQIWSRSATGRTLTGSVGLGDVLLVVAHDSEFNPEVLVLTSRGHLGWISADYLFGLEWVREK